MSRKQRESHRVQLNNFFLPLCSDLILINFKIVNLHAPSQVVTICPLISELFLFSLSDLSFLLSTIYHVNVQLYIGRTTFLNGQTLILGCTHVCNVAFGGIFLLTSGLRVFVFSDKNLSFFGLLFSTSTSLIQTT